MCKGQDKVEPTGEGVSEEPGVISTVPDSRLGWDFSHILPIFAMTSCCLKQFGVSHHGDLLCTPSQDCRLLEIHTLRWQSQPSQSVLTLYLAIFLLNVTCQLCIC